jgi:hypothetical protein
MINADGTGEGVHVLDITIMGTLEISASARSDRHEMLSDLGMENVSIGIDSSTGETVRITIRTTRNPLPSPRFSGTVMYRIHHVRL